MKRNLDGVYFRVERNGKWGNVCLSDMTKEERHSLIGNKDSKYLLACVDILCERIREIGDTLDIVAGPEDEEE